MCDKTMHNPLALSFPKQKGLAILIKAGDFNWALLVKKTWAGQVQLSLLGITKSAITEQEETLGHFIYPPSTYEKYCLLILTSLGSFLIKWVSRPWGCKMDKPTI